MPRPPPPPPDDGGPAPIEAEPPQQDAPPPAQPPPRAPAAHQTSPLTAQRLALYGSASTAAAIGVIARAFRERSNFYAATVWLARSNGCMLVLLNFAIFMTFMWGKLVQAIFFGRLRSIEVEHLYERSWYAVTETLLAMTIFRDEFDSSFVLLFGTLLFLKVFHWLASDRVELMEQSQSVSRLFHARMVSVLWTLLCLDLFLVAFTIEVLLLDKQRMGIMIMFASEFMILTATLGSTMAKYTITTIDMQNEEPWQAKSMYLSAVDLVTDFFKLTTYVVFFCLILTYYGLPLNIVRDVYVTARSFFGRIRDLLRYRAATRNMDTRFPNATRQDLDRTDGTCIICREDMVPLEEEEQQRGDVQVHPGGLNETPKKLSCGHVFHFHCLRSWLERQQSCPTCRRTVFDRGEEGAGTQPQQEQQPPPQQPQQQQQQQPHQQQQQNPPGSLPSTLPDPARERLQQLLGTVMQGQQATTAASIPPPSQPPPPPPSTLDPPRGPAATHLPSPSDSPPQPQLQAPTTDARTAARLAALRRVDALTGRPSGMRSVTVPVPYTGTGTEAIPSSSPTHNPTSIKHQLTILHQAQADLFRISMDLTRVLSFLQGESGDPSHDQSAASVVVVPDEDVASSSSSSSASTTRGAAHVGDKGKARQVVE